MGAINLENNQMTINLDEIIKVAVTTALEVSDKRKIERLKERFDRRLRNTELLLKNYRSLVVHRNDSVYSIQKASEILDDIDSYDDENEYCFGALKESAERTATVVAHISIMIDTFQYMAESERLKPEYLISCKLIRKMYINQEIKSFDEIMSDLAISQRTLYRHKSTGIQFLSGLIFGVDSLKFR